MKIQGNYIDILARTICFSAFEIEEGKIVNATILENNEVANEPYILPGFIDAHIHIESALLAPSQFARMAVCHGTVATVSDPHEIANVLGMSGIDYMIENGATVPFYFNFGAPSCVPATPFETAGAILGPDDIEEIFKKYPNVKYLAEVMNYPGVLAGDADMMAKIAIAKAYNKQIDGHAPGLRGESAKLYAQKGPSTDHECFTLAEAEDKLAVGMKVLIREGSAAKNFEALIPLVPKYYKDLMFCSDDKHPDVLKLGHINELVARALAMGFDLYEVLQMACINPIMHYGLDHGYLREGQSADFILVDDLQKMTVAATYIKGIKVAENGMPLFENIFAKVVNKFDCKMPVLADLQVKEAANLPVIEALDGQLITNKIVVNLPVINNCQQIDIEQDILKIVVLNRYQSQKPAVAFIKNFGIKNGAIASSVAHDSHNIVAVGSSDELILRAISLVVNHKGGLAAVCGVGDEQILPLPVAGIMSDGDAWQVAKQYEAIDLFVKQKLGSTLTAPFMTLSFMALPVIPSLKLTDRGLFDVDCFEFVNN